MPHGPDGRKRIERPLITEAPSSSQTSQRRTFTPLPSLGLEARTNLEREGHPRLVRQVAEFAGTTLSGSDISEQGTTNALGLEVEEQATRSLSPSQHVERGRLTEHDLSSVEANISARERESRVTLKEEIRTLKEEEGELTSAFLSSFSDLDATARDQFMKQMHKTHDHWVHITQFESWQQDRSHNEDECDRAIRQRTALIANLYKNMWSGIGIQPETDTQSEASMTPKGLSTPAGEVLASDQKQSDVKEEAQVWVNIGSDEDIKEIASYELQRAISEGNLDKEAEFLFGGIKELVEKKKRTEAEDKSLIAEWRNLETTGSEEIREIMVSTIEKVSESFDDGDFDEGAQVWVGSGFAEEYLTAQETPQSSRSDQASHVYASQDHPPSLTHYPDSQEVTFSPDSAKQSVLNFGREIFQRRIFDSGEIYRKYLRWSQPKLKLTEDEKKDYLQQIMQSSINNEKEVDSYPQIKELHHLKTHEFLTDAPQGKHPTRDKDVVFYRARARAESKQKEPQSRLSLQLNPLRAAKVFDYISSELVSKHSDVTAARLTGPSDIHKRTESIIIYLKERNEQTAYEIAQQLNEKFGDTSFCSGAPVGMYEMFSGIGYAEKSDSSPKSHGEIMAEAIASAMESSSDYVKHLEQQNKSITKQKLQKYFEEQFLAALKEKGINPEMPYKSANGSGSAEEYLTAQETPQSSRSDQALHVYASQDHPPSLTHYRDDVQIGSDDEVKNLMLLGIIPNDGEDGEKFLKEWRASEETANKETREEMEKYIEKVREVQQE